MRNTAAPLAESPDLGVHGGRRVHTSGGWCNALNSKEVFLTRYYVGVDTGKRHHTACVHDALEATFSKPFTISVNRQGFERFLSLLEQLGPREETLVGLEASPSAEGPADPTP